MNENKIKHADQILKFLLENNSAYSVRNDGPKYFTKYNCKYSESSSIVENDLIHVYGLININSNADVITLTEKGLIAARRGVNNYLNDLNNQRQLDELAKKASIENLIVSKKALNRVNLTIVIGILSLIATIFFGILGFIF